MFTGEHDLYSQTNTLYRKIENFDIKSVGSIAKRNGTKLIYHDTQKLFTVTTTKLVYIFQENNKYRVFNLFDFSVVKGETDNPVGLTFNGVVFNDKISTYARAGPITVARISGQNGVFDTDLHGNINKLTLTAAPSDPTLFVSLPGRSLIVEGGQLHFSKYGSYNDFTVGTGPQDGYVLIAVGGHDSYFSDVVYYDNYIVLATSTSLYRVEYSAVNPFTTTSTTPFPKITKLYSGGVNRKTLTIVGQNLFFANSKGIYIVQQGILQASTFSVKDITLISRHITSEEKYAIVEMSASYKDENTFYCMRNDGIAFQCLIANGRAAFSRQTCGERKYLSLSEDARAFVSESVSTQSTIHYVELMTKYPYLSDNMRRFNVLDEILNFDKYHFLDCFVAKQQLILINSIPISNSRFESTASLDVDSSYMYYDRNDSRIKSVKILTKNGNIYSHDGDIPKTIFILGKLLNDVDISDINAYRNGQELYMTYVDIQEGKMYMKTRLVHEGGDTVTVDGFFAVFGFGYLSEIEILLRFKNRTEVQQLELGFFDTTLIKTTAFTREGREVTDTVRACYTSQFTSLIQPTKDWNKEKLMVIEIPEGYSSVITTLGGLVDDDSSRGS